MIDTRNWSFAKRALYELKLQQEKKQRDYQAAAKVWVLVKLANQVTKWYQLPKDLQKAIKYELQRTTNFDYKSMLKDAIINVPISKYGKNGRVKISCGRIIAVKLKHQTRVKINCITRSQWIKLKFKFGFLPSYFATINYLRHDYNPANQKRITHDLRRIIWHDYWQLRRQINDKAN